jgi:hypothetical protein
MLLNQRNEIVCQCLRTALIQRSPPDAPSLAALRAGPAIDRARSVQIVAQHPSAISPTVLT